MVATYQLVLPTLFSRPTDAAFSTFVLNETTDYYAVPFFAPSADTITQLGVNVSAISGSPNLEISLQGVSNGVPDGTIKASGNAKATWAAATGWTWQTLTSSYTPTAGENLAYVVKLTSGTSATINVRISGTPGHPCGVTFDNATATTTRLASIAVWGAKGSGTTWCWGHPVSTGNTTGITNASTIESGMEFTVPSWCSTMAIGGARVLARLTSTATSVEVGIYAGGNAGDTTRAASVTVTGNDVQQVSALVPIVVWWSPQTFNAGDKFRIATRVTAGTMNEYGYTVTATEDLLAHAGIWGNGVLMRSRRTTGNWTDSTTNLVFIEPIATDVTIPSGGGSVALPLVRAF